MLSIFSQTTLLISLQLNLILLGFLFYRFLKWRSFYKNTVTTLNNLNQNHLKDLDQNIYKNVMLAAFSLNPKAFQDFFEKLDLCVGNFKEEIEKTAASQYQSAPDKLETIEQAQEVYETLSQDIEQVEEQGEETATEETATEETAREETAREETATEEAATEEAATEEAVTEETATEETVTEEAATEEAATEETATEETATEEAATEETATEEAATEETATEEAATEETVTEEAVSEIKEDEGQEISAGDQVDQLITEQKETPVEETPVEENIVGGSIEDNPLEIDLGLDDENQEKSDQPSETK